MSQRSPKVLAVASAGGHFVQLRRLAPALETGEVVYLTTDKGYADQVAPARLRAVIDASRWNKFKLLLMLAQITWAVLRERPDVVITTGAAPGYFAIRLGRLLGARTMWIDSIANVDEMSMSGAMAKKHAHRCLTQWEHLAKETGPEFCGATL